LYVPKIITTAFILPLLFGMVCVLFFLALLQHLKERQNNTKEKENEFIV
jgi:hypothetical protein